eukprot:gene2297-1437_t
MAVRQERGGQEGETREQGEKSDGSITLTRPQRCAMRGSVQEVELEHTPFLRLVKEKVWTSVEISKWGYRRITVHASGSQKHTSSAWHVSLKVKCMLHHHNKHHKGVRGGEWLAAVRHAYTDEGNHSFLDPSVASHCMEIHGASKRNGLPLVFSTNSYTIHYLFIYLPWIARGEAENAKDIAIAAYTSAHEVTNNNTNNNPLNKQIHVDIYICIRIFHSALKEPLSGAAHNKKGKKSITDIKICLTDMYQSHADTYPYIKIPAGLARCQRTTPASTASTATPQGYSQGEPHLRRIPFEVPGTGPKALVRALAPYSRAATRASKTSSAPPSEPVARRGAAALCEVSSSSGTGSALARGPSPIRFASTSADPHASSGFLRSGARGSAVSAPAGAATMSTRLMSTTADTAVTKGFLAIAGGAFVGRYKPQCGRNKANKKRPLMAVRQERGDKRGRQENKVKRAMVALHLQDRSAVLCGDLSKRSSWSTRLVGSLALANVILVFLRLVKEKWEVLERCGRRWKYPNGGGYRRITVHASGSQKHTSSAWHVSLKVKCMLHHHNTHHKGVRGGEWLAAVRHAYTDEGNHSFLDPSVASHCMEIHGASKRNGLPLVFSTNSYTIHYLFIYLPWIARGEAENAKDIAIAAYTSAHEVTNNNTNNNPLNKQIHVDIYICIRIFHSALKEPLSGAAHNKKGKKCFKTPYKDMSHRYVPITCRYVSIYQDTGGLARCQRTTPASTASTATPQGYSQGEPHLRRIPFEVPGTGPKALVRALAPYSRAATRASKTSSAPPSEPVARRGAAALCEVSSSGTGSALARGPSPIRFASTSADPHASSGFLRSGARGSAVSAPAGAATMSTRLMSTTADTAVTKGFLAIAGGAFVGRYKPQCGRNKANKKRPLMAVRQERGDKRGRQENKVKRAMVALHLQDRSAVLCGDLSKRVWTSVEISKWGYRRITVHASGSQKHTSSAWHVSLKVKCMLHHHNTHHKGVRGGEWLAAVRHAYTDEGNHSFLDPSVASHCMEIHGASKRNGLPLVFSTNSYTIHYLFIYLPWIARGEAENAKDIAIAAYTSAHEVTNNNTNNNPLNKQIHVDIYICIRIFHSALKEPLSGAAHNKKGKKSALKPPYKDMSHRYVPITCRYVSIYQDTGGASTLPTHHASIYREHRHASGYSQGEPHLRRIPFEVPGTGPKALVRALAPYSRAATRASKTSSAPPSEPVARRGAAALCEVSSSSGTGSALARGPSPIRFASTSADPHASSGFLRSGARGSAVSAPAGAATMSTRLMSTTADTAVTKGFLAIAGGAFVGRYKPQCGRNKANKKRREGDKSMCVYAVKSYGEGDTLCRQRRVRECEKRRSGGAANILLSLMRQVICCIIEGIDLKKYYEYQ